MLIYNSAISLGGATRLQRVMDIAEQAALSESDRDSAHYHQHHQAQSQTGHKHITDYMSDEAKELANKPMRRFENLVVNLTHSSVYAPDGISLSGKLVCSSHVWSMSNGSGMMILFVSFHREDTNVQSSVAWSSHLDPIFASNLERDAALSWQYFGSTEGFMRRFPGTQWPHKGSTKSEPIKDFRTQDWFMQAASSPKDIVSRGPSGRDSEWRRFWRVAR